MRVFEHGYLGGRYILATHDAAPDEEQEPSATAPPPADELNSTLSMLGPVFAYDTRVNHDQPDSGVFINASWLFGVDFLGNEFRHDKLTATGAVYRRVNSRTVLAGKAALCSVNGQVPYYDMCLFGSSADLRGYPAGRYRDEASWAVQGELRHNLSTRWGIIAFAGVGGIAPSIGGFFDEGNLLPAAGGGVRYRPFKGNDVQLRIDIAVGKNDNGIYVGIGEAF